MSVAGATWKHVLTTLPGTTPPTEQVQVGFLEKPNGTRYTRRRNGYNELAFSVNDPGDLADLESAVYRRAIKSYRNGVCRFNGQIVEHEETKEGFAIVARDPYFNMRWRRVRDNVTLGAGDAGLQAWALIALQNGYWSSFLKQGTIDASTSIPAADYAQGMVVADQVETLTKIVASFSFTVDALDGVAGYMAEWVARHPVDVVRPRARFEFGQDTLENVADYTRAAIPLVNRADITGTTAAGRPYVASAESTISPPIHGLWEDERGHVLETIYAKALEIAATFRMHYPKYAISITPTAEAPQLFTDFDVIDKVPVLLERRGRTIEGDLPVLRATITLDDDSGAETLTELVLVDEDQDT